MDSASGDAVPSRPAGIISPAIDFLLVGGLSVLAFVPLLLSGRDDLPFVTIGALAWAQILVNMSHFMASYRIVYRDRAMILRHKWATIGVPLALLLYILVAVEQARFGDPLLVGLLVAASSGYLAWHYTGQVWGMMASFSYLDGIRIEPGERRLIRGSLRILLAWHVVWAAHIWMGQSSLGEPSWMATLYRVASVGALSALGVGAAGLLRMRRRTGRLPPARAMTAWIAIFVWYAVMARFGLAGLFLVQLAHAVQYLEFPARIELNRATRAGARSALWHMLWYAGVLLGVSYIVTQFVPGPAMSSVAQLVDGRPSVVPVLILTFINIHHYFTDGVIWKISNPEVRKDLFSHVAPLGAAPSGAEAGPGLTPAAARESSRKPVKAAR